MTSSPRLLAAALVLVLAGCVAPVGPVEVTRFHVPEVQVLGRGAISVEPAAGMDGSSLEYRSYAVAVGQELARAGYSEVLPGESGAQVARVRIERTTLAPMNSGNPVSVGLGGSTGSYGSGVGLGIGIDLSGPPPAQVQTRLSVTISDRATGRTLWEGRADFALRASSPMANTQLAAPKLAEALFKDFPGNSGETILVK